ncbi:hypothetical protein [Pseudomonas sp.]|uniref:hypothetical protein n=1 Tax=Pseudomonas sp. TaxID=306 RepID=UPI002FCB3974
MSNRGVHPAIYYLGRECRRNGGGKLANPFAPISVRGSWFLAGWNDMDIEIINERQTTGPAAPPAPGTGSLAA